MTQEETRLRHNREWVRAFGRGLRYLSIRAFVLLLTVLVGIYAAIWVVNWGGASDPKRKAEIEYRVRFGLGGTSFWQRQDITHDEKLALVDQHIQRAFEAADLDQPFAIRSIRYFREACMLSLGTSIKRRTRTGSTAVSAILLEAVPMTLLLFGVANVIVFIGGILIALVLSQRYGSLLDRLTTLSAPILSAPPWFHGFILIVIFASLLKLLPWGGVISPPIPETTFGYVLDVLKHMILPVSALILGGLPSAVYANRALFMTHSSEDYIDLAQAKGLSPGRLRFRYILRPTMPPIITNFVFITIVAWEGVIITENIFNWPGLGRIFIEAISIFDISLVTGAVVLFAYLIALGVLFLDVMYVLVDPRVALGAKRRA